MLSIIISTYQPNFLNALKKNIEETVGIPYEIIKIDNNRKMGICQAYNLGATLAKFQYLCFIHEDIAFKTVKWATPLIKKFREDVNTGLIGVAGSKYKSLSPSAWYGKEDLDFINLIQHSKQKKNEFIKYISNEFEEVTCLDGVFLFTSKEIWTENKFDENNFKDFHCYDIDFSLNISLKKKIFVTNHVLLEHFSMGSYDKSWIDETIKFNNKWAHLLPRGEINPKIQRKFEWENKLKFLHMMYSYKYPINKLLIVYLKFGFFRFFSITKALKTMNFLISVYIKNIYGKSIS